jgi:hypothetical protein
MGQPPIFFSCIPGIAHNQQRFSQSASHHAAMCRECRLRQLLQPPSNLPPFHILTSQFCTAVSIDTCTAIARFFVGFGKIHAKIPISGCDNAQKPRLKPEPSLSPEGLGLKARARNSSSPGSRKPSLSQGFQAEPGPHITKLWALPRSRPYSTYHKTD